MQSCGSRKRKGPAAAQPAAAAAGVTVNLSSPKKAAVEAVAAAAGPSSFEDKVQDDFECTVCKDLIVFCHSVVPCGHMLCGECLHQWLAKNPSCPVCRRALPLTPLA
jgi:hypothetical protein